jgi:hypothetical protein
LIAGIHRLSKTKTLISCQTPDRENFQNYCMNDWNLATF